MSEEISNRNSISTPQVIKIGGEGFRFLGRKADQNTGEVVKWTVAGLGVLLAVFNMDIIRQFMQDAAATGTAAVRLSAAVISLAAIWYVATRPKLHRLLAMMVDRTLDSIHMWWIDRDKFGAANYAISELKKEVKIAQASESTVGSIRDRATERMNSHKSAAREATVAANGIQKEILRRRSNPDVPGNSQLARYTPAQLQTSFDLKKSQARSHYDFFMSESERVNGYNEDLAKIGIIIDAVNAQVTKLGTDLDIATEAWDSEKDNMIADEAASRVVDSPARRDYDRALTGIKNEAFQMRARARMYMNMLDPTVKAYQADQAAGSIADDEFFNQFASDLGLDAGDVKTKLLPATAASTAELPDVAELLGSRPAQKTPVMASTGRRTSFDDLLGGKH